jgi:hypothetical protein
MDNQHELWPEWMEYFRFPIEPPLKPPGLWYPSYPHFPAALLILALLSEGRIIRPDPPTC